MSKGGKKNGFDLFGGLFDINGDGITDAGEEFMAYLSYEQWVKDHRTPSSSGTSTTRPPYPRRVPTVKKPDYSWRETCEYGDEYGIYPKDYETEAEYDEALEQAKYAWRDNAEIDYYLGIYPEDFETEDEFNEALRRAQPQPQTVTINFTFEVSIPALNAVDAIKPEDYPDKHMYEAALQLAKIKNGFVGYASKKDKQLDIALCEFILNHPEILASKYLTLDNEFQYAKAALEHFELPIKPKKASEKLSAYDIFAPLCKKDPLLAYRVWSWWYENFYPYRGFEGRDSEVIFLVAADFESLPAPFIAKLISRTMRDEAFAEAIATASVFSCNAVEAIVYRLLKQNAPDAAQRLVITYLGGPFAKADAVYKFVRDSLDYCRDYSSIKPMERFRESIFPIFKTIRFKKVQNCLPRREKEIDAYLEEMNKR